MNKAIADSGIRIPCQSTQGFFDAWFQMLRPIHKLANNEIKILSTMARFRYELSLKMDKDILDEYMTTTEMRSKIREACGMSKSCYQVSIHKLKEKKALVDGKMNPKLIPNLNGNSYKLMLFFDLKTNGPEQTKQPAGVGGGKGTQDGQSLGEQDGGELLGGPEDTVGQSGFGQPEQGTV